MKIIKFGIALFTLVTISISCSKDTETPAEENKYLVDTNIKYVFTEQIIESAIGTPNAVEQVTNGIKTYKVVYNTLYQGEMINASGTITVPDIPGEYPLALIQRGTILSNSSAPSEGTLPFYEAFGGFGFIVFVPDLIGYGSSSEYLHPYLNYEYTSSASTDMYYAVQEFLDEQSQITTNNQFFISGYSQGGYSAMATYKYIEENIDDIEITAVGPGAGGYDIMALVENILSEETYPATILLVMPIVTINELYTNEPMENIFNSPYKELIQDVIDGNKEWSEIAGDLSPIIKELFNPELIDDLIAGEDTFLTPYLIANSVHDWAPAKPTIFSHHPLDEIIPIETSYSSIAKMEENGSTSTTFVEITEDMISPGASSIHGAAGLPSIVISMMSFKGIN